MTSKWIEDVISRFLHNPVGSEWNEIKEILTKVDSALRKAMHGTDNEYLHDEIYELLYGKPMMTSDNFGEFEDDKTS